MANSVTFPPSVGGSGLTVTDDSNPTTGLANGGHRVRFVPALSQVVAVAGNTVTKAAEAAASAETAYNWATKTDGPVSGGEYSAKHHAEIAAARAGDALDSANLASSSASSAANSANSAEQDAQAVADALAAIQDGPVASINGQGGVITLKSVGGQSLLGTGDIDVDAGVSVFGDVSAYVTQVKTYTITNYNSFSTYSVSASSGSVSIVGDSVTFTAPNVAGNVTLTITKDGKPNVFTVAVLAAGVQTPVNQSPTNNAIDQNGTVTLTASAFGWFGLSDTHLNSDWQVAIDAAFNTVIASSLADAVNKTSWTVSGLSVSQTYYWRVRYRGTNNGVSEWSAPFSFSTKSTFGGLIGTQGGQGFGVGEYPHSLPSGFSALSGTGDPASANYGNYQYSDGSIMVFVPLFYYRIGHTSSPRYAAYGLNAVDIVGVETFASEAAANAAGYALHRAFKDGGSVKSGFFVDKYLASKNGSTSCRSVKDGVPISLTTSTSHTNSNGMVTSEGACTGILADAVLLSRSRGVGTFNAASIFMYDALAALSLAHGQASTSATHCAWYNAINNFPKGCNNGSLADVNDSGVTFTTAGDSGGAAKPKTGSGNPFAKTTHNGQACGVTDLNGSMWQVMLGVTSPGSSATDTAQVANGNAYVLKTSVALSSLRAGWNGTNDAWGDATNLATKYDLISGFFPWGSATGSVYFGNGSNQVFSGATSSTSYLRKCCGVQEATAGTSASGTNQFGADECYQYNRANLFPLASGGWFYAAGAGVFYRGWGDGRSHSDAGFGFRAAAYGL